MRCKSTACTDHGLDPRLPCRYCFKMGNTVIDVDIPEQIKALDARLDVLVKRARQMRRQAEKTALEHARLKIAQEQARSRINSMISRLKSLERHT